jgi:hypothetical protein
MELQLRELVGNKVRLRIAYFYWIWYGVWEMVHLALDAQPAWLQQRDGSM